MGGKDNLHVGIQFANQADETLLPLYVEGHFGLVHEKYTPTIVLHEHGEENDKHLLFTRRELVGIERIAILFEEDFVALADDGFAQIGRAHV